MPTRLYYVMATIAALLLMQSVSADWLPVSSPAQPPTAFRFQQTGDSLQLTVRIARDGDVSPIVAIGWWDGQATVLRSSAATATVQGDHVDYLWTVSKPAAGTTPRLAIAARWPGGPNDAPRRTERFRHTGPGATHDGLSANPEYWQPLDLAELERQLADQSLRPRMSVEMVADGKVTIVIDDADGRRVRNLVAAAERPAGTHAFTWDGLDDDGQIAPAGDYRWRAIQHTGITPDYQFSWANGGEDMITPFGPNHHLFESATTNGKLVFFAAPLTEGGYALIAVDEDGKWQQGFTQIHGTGIHDVACAADATTFYVAHDGSSWLDKIDRSGNWRAEVPITLTRYDIATGNSIDFPNRQRFARLDIHEWGPGSKNQALATHLSLTGMVLLDGKLYIGSRASQAILVVDPATATVERRIALPSPGPLAVLGTQLYAVSGTAVVAVDLASGKTTPVIAAGAVEPRGMTAADGRLYISDGTTHTIRIYDTSGKALGSLGEPGGAYEGTFRPERLVEPRGITVLHNRLWVTESRRNPKRVTGWNLTTAKVEITKAGNPPYGSPGSAIDPADASRWIGLRSAWRVDPTTGEATCTSVLQREEGHLGGRIDFAQHYRMIHRDGRTFVLGMAKAQIVSELMPDGTLRDLAIAGAVPGFRYACAWKPPTALYEALALAYPDKTFDPDDRNTGRDIGMLWVDLNGDGECQVDEFQFSTLADRFGGGYWGHDQYDLTYRYPAVVDGKTVLVTLTPDGYHDSGAPRYPDLDAACRAGVPIDLDRTNAETSVDRFGNLLVNGSPYMASFAPDGRTLWRYPNQWVGVHGSHKAPLPKPGVMQGNLFFLGTAPIADDTDAIMTIGNHGRCFVLTSDGLYLDEMFADVRVSFQRDEWMIGGESFGGIFTRTDDGTYYLQVGSGGYRVYHVKGFDSLRRSAGDFALTAEQVAAATRAQSLTTVAADEGPRDSGLPLTWTRDDAFPVTVDLHVSGDALQLSYTVADESPWVNKGKDWTLLFKTGDCIDLQFAADPDANPKRRSAAAGDRRLLIAPHGNKNIAVLYDYVSPQGADPVEFASPHRTVRVDKVTRLDAAQIRVERGRSTYTVRATIPLATLGLTAAQVGELRGDLGVIYGDADGTINVMRNHWSNRETALVNDVPGEAMLHPDRWGTLRLQSEPRRYTLQVAGVLGNSGGSGDGLVTMNPKEALGLGAVVDRYDTVWDRLGDRLLARMSADGRQLATYPLPASNDRKDAIAATADWITLLLRGKLYRLPIDAPAGTAPEAMNLSAQYMSVGQHDGRLAIATDREILWLTPGTGETTRIRALDGGDISGLDVMPDGTVATVDERKMRGGRPTFVDGYWYAHGWHSTLYRYNTEKRADPGVVLGGNSGHFIGRMDENAEIVTGRSMVPLAFDNYLIGNEMGGAHAIRWDATERRFVITRRLGGLQSAGGLTLDLDGRIYCNRGYWRWDDEPDSPQLDGGPVTGLGQGVTLGNGALVMAGSQYVTHPRILYGPSDAPIKGSGKHAPVIADPPTGAAVMPHGNQQHLLLLYPDGRLHHVRIGGTGEPYELLAESRLQANPAVKAYTSMAALDAETLLAAGDGQVIAFTRDGDTWREQSRWRTWQGDAAGSFGPSIYITSDQGRLWVADVQAHRVLCFDAASHALIASFGTAGKAGSALTELHEPTRIAASGDRAIVFDSKNFRLIKLTLNPQSPQQDTP